MRRQAKLRVVATPSPRQALQEGVDSFLQRGRARNLSASTLRFCRTRLRALTDYLVRRGPNTGPEDITPAIPREFLASERERREMPQDTRGPTSDSQAPSTASQCLAERPFPVCPAAVQRTPQLGR